MSCEPAGSLWSRDLERSASRCARIPCPLRSEPTSRSWISIAFQNAPVVHQRLAIVGLVREKGLERLHRLVGESRALVIQRQLQLRLPSDIRTQTGPEQNVSVKSYRPVQLALAAKQGAEGKIRLQRLGIELRSLGELSDGCIWIVGKNVSETRQVGAGGVFRPSFTR